MSNIYNKFTSKNDQKHLNKIKIQSLQLRNYVKIYVEGEMDRKFYNLYYIDQLVKSSNYKLKKDNIKIIVCCCKSNVLDLMKYNEKTNNNFHEDFYVVDKDYDFNFVKKEYNNLLVTSCYSIENYYFTDENIKGLCGLFLIEESIVDKFKKIVSSLTNYFAVCMYNVEFSKRCIEIGKFNILNILDDQYDLNSNALIKLDFYRRKLIEFENKDQYNIRVKYLSDIMNVRGKDLVLIFNLLSKKKQNIEFDLNELINYEHKNNFKIDLKF